jgi:predicted glycosyltransferase
MAGKRLRIAFCPAHPAQLWLLRPIVEKVSKFADVVWVLRDKDCTVTIAKAMGLDYFMLTTAAKGLFGNAREFLIAMLKAAGLTRREKIDMWVTKYGPCVMAARLLGRKAVSFNDDDADVVPFIAWTSYPFANVTIVTSVTRMKHFECRAIRFPGYYELCYLHPNVFQPDSMVFAELGLAADERYAIARLSSLQSHHDVGIQGLSEELLRGVLRMLPKGIKLFVTSEKPLLPEFEPYRISIAPERIHHALAFAEFCLGDRQTMTAEAAVLGTPALRINGFVGRLSYLADFEAYGLAYGFYPGQESELLMNWRLFLVKTIARVFSEVARKKSILLSGLRM